MQVATVGYEKLMLYKWMSMITWGWSTCGPGMHREPGERYRLSWASSSFKKKIGRYQNPILDKYPVTVSQIIQDGIEL